MTMISEQYMAIYVSIVIIDPFTKTSIMYLKKLKFIYFFSKKAESELQQAMELY